MGRAVLAAVTAATMLLGARGVAAEPLPSPGIPPPGSNNYHCRPGGDHPDPVLRGLGYCVFALDYGHRGTDPVEESAAELGAFVDRVLAATGASHVLLVGHSQGGMMPRYWMRFLGGAEKVRGLVGLAPSNHGTTVAAAPAGGNGGCRSCVEQIAGSAFLDRLNAGGDTLPGINHTVVETRYDEIVTPYTSAFLHGPRVTDVTLQDDCPLDLAEHVGIVYDPVAL